MSVCRLKARLQEAGTEGVVGIQPIGPSIRCKTRPSGKFLIAFTMSMSNISALFFCVLIIVLSILQTMKFGVILFVKNLDHLHDNWILQFELRQIEAIDKGKVESTKEGYGHQLHHRGDNVGGQGI